MRVLHSRARGLWLLTTALALVALLSRTGRSGTREVDRNAASPDVGLQQVATGLGSITSITKPSGPNWSPATAKAVALNLTVTQSTALGDLRLSPVGRSLPLASTINYRPRQTRANNAIALLGAAGDIVIHSDQVSGSVHVILDVNGYFQ